MCSGLARWGLRLMRGYALSCRRAISLWRCYLALVGLLVITSASAKAEKASCDRLVSLAPSVTELLFDLGLGERLVGATEFCRYPESALKIPRIGGYLDLNIERVVLSNPTIVFGLQEGVAQVSALSRFSIPVELLNHSSLSGIKSSYTAVAERCGVAERARLRLAEFAEREAAIRSRCADQSSCRGRPAGAAPLRIMIVVGRTREGSADSGVYLSGSDGFYAEIVSLLGATNVHQGRTIAMPTISSEGILKLAPDVIVDVVNVDDRAGVSQARRFWDRFPNLPAVRLGRVIVLSDDFASIPGPRYILLAEKLAGVVCGCEAGKQ